ncbi:MAG: cell division protein ZapA [Thiotrichales bacterium]|nr:cell division protein ZapA [Thiotrichales bacterium]
MDADRISVAVQILDKEYRFSCPEEESEALVGAARCVNRKMAEIRDSGKVIGMERIAIMAAINIAHELLDTNSEVAESSDQLPKQLNALQNKIEQALIDVRQMEI